SWRGQCVLVACTNTADTITEYFLVFNMIFWIIKIMDSRMRRQEAAATTRGATDEGNLRGVNWRRGGRGEGSGGRRCRQRRHRGRRSLSSKCWDPAPRPKGPCGR